MYCPRCAAQNLEGAKFCRVCGTNLETVALALSDQYHPAKLSSDTDTELDSGPTWLEKRKEGVSSIIQGSGLLGASLLIGVALGLFSNQPDWIFVWLVFVGWMACWGVISLTSGIGSLMESKSILLQMGLKASAIPAPASQPFLTADRELVTDELGTPRLTPPSSVTEQTTTQLVKPERTSKESG